METQSITLHTKQWQAFNFKKQFGAAIAGVQSGKTTVGALWAVRKIQEFPDKDGLIFAPTYPILRQSTLQKFFGMFPQYRQFYKEQKGVIELPTGGNVYIRSADNPFGLEGMTIHWAWGDEAGLMSVLVWMVIRARVSTTGGQVFFTTTPYNLGWLYQDVYLKAGKDPDIEVYTWASVDNPGQNKDFIEKEKSRLSPEQFARRYLGEFRKIEGIVYDLPGEAIIHPDEKVMQKLSSAEITLGGIDWGFRNPAAIVVMKYADRAWYVVDEWYQIEKTTAEIIEQAKRLQDRWGINRFYADCAEPDRIQEMRAKGFYTLEANKDIEGGISLVQQAIRENRFYVFNTCTNFIDEINAYHYAEPKERNNQLQPPKELPEKINDHLMDAMRYVVKTYQPEGPDDRFLKARVERNRTKTRRFS